MKFKYTSLILIIWASCIQAGSILSSENLGSPTGLANARSMGMAGTSIANPSAFDLPRLNPAALQNINLSRFAIQYTYESNHYKIDENSAKSIYSNFDGFMFGIPVSDKIAFAVGLVPYSRMDFKASINDEIEEESYTQILTGTGGTNALNLSLSFKVIKNLSLGATGLFYFGRIQKDLVINFMDSQYFTTKNSLASRLYGYGATFGFLYDLTQNFMIGAIWRPEVSLNLKTYRDYKSMDDRTSITYLYSSDTLKGSSELPESYGLGAGLKLSPKWFIAADIMYTDWESFKLNNQLVTRTRNVYKYSLGIEHQPSFNLYASLFKKSIYRIGFAYEPYYLKDKSGNNINEWYFTSGIGIPIWNYSSRANIGIAYGQRGSLKNNGLTENFFRIILSLDAGEKWFIRR